MADTLFNWRPKRLHRFAAPLFAVLIGGLFALDLLLPLGVAAAITYSVVLMGLCRFLPRRQLATWGTVCVSLTIAGAYLSPSGDLELHAVVNRLLSIIAIVATIFFAREWRGICETAEHHAKENERQRFFELSRDLLLVGGFNGYPQRINPALANLLGYDQDELMSMPYLDLVHPHDRPETSAKIRQVASGAFVDAFQHRVVTRSGGIRWIEWNSPASSLEEGVFYASGRDITEKLHVERQLKETKEFLRGAIDSLSIHVCVLNQQGDIVLVNRAWQEFALRNGSDGTKTGVGANYLHVCQHAAAVGADGAAETLAGIDGVLLGDEGSFTLEYPCEGPDAQLWFRCRAARFEFEEQKWVIVSHEDITEYRAAERRRDQLKKNLNEAECDLQMLTAIVELSEDAVVGMDLNGIVTRWNTGAERVYGYCGSEVIGSSMDMLIPENRMCEVLEFLERLEDGETIEGIETQRLHKDGRLIDVSLTISPIRNSRKDIIGASVITRDITAKKSVERELAELQGRFERALRATCDGFWEWDIKTNRVWYAARFRELLGYGNDDEFPETLDNWTTRLHPDDSEPTLKTLGRHLVADVPFDVEYRLRTADDSYRWYRCRGVSLRNESGESVQMSGSLQDITDRRQSELSLREKEEQLRHAQKMHAVGSLAGGMAHEFNNLLQAILGYTSFALQGLDEDDPRCQDLVQVQRASERAANLTQQLLSFGRRQAPQRMMTDARELVADLADLLRPLLGERIAVRVRIPATPAWIEGDSDQLSHMLFNLCVNARDAMPEGGTLEISVTTTWRHAPGFISHDDSLGKQYAMISVTDNGVGMSDRIKQHIYEPFFTTKRDGQGTGLGLSMVYNVVDDHGGFIEVDSEPGLGTTFDVFLPAIAHQAMHHREDTQPAQVGASTILVAEDDPTLRSMLPRILEEAGYSVLIAEDGASAVRIFMEGHEKIAAAILDIVMPGLSGPKAAEHIRREAPNIPILFCTGYAPDAAEVEPVLHSGATLLRKPVSPQQLLHSIGTLLKLTQPVPCGEEPHTHPLAIPTEQA